VYCPVCQSHDTGKTGSGMYYCSKCLIEFNYHQDEPRLYYMDPEGNPIKIDSQETAAKLANYFEKESQLVLEGSASEPDINDILYKIISRDH